MTTPIGVFTNNLTDIGTIFKPYNSGTKVLNKFFTKDSQDIGNLLQPYTSGTQNNIGMKTKDGTDIGTLYQTYGIFSPTGTYTQTTSGQYTIFTFTGNGSVVSSNGSNQTITVYYLVVGGGGAGGFNKGGGGGAGGLLQNSFTISSSDTISVTVGSGGISATDVTTLQANGKGGNSSIIFSRNTSNNKIAIGGGYGSVSVSYGGTAGVPGDGGSSGGAGNGTPNGSLANNSTPTDGQGSKGGASTSNYSAGGGGGAGAVGGNGSNIGGSGGIGVLCSQLGISSLYPSTYWAGGGGGGGISVAATFIWETPHPYPGNFPGNYDSRNTPSLNILYTINPYNKYIITFDPLTSTEQDSDLFYIKNGDGADIISPRSGNSGWTPVVVSGGGSMRFVLTSNWFNRNNIDYYGIRITVTENVYLNSITGGVGAGGSGGGGGGGSFNGVSSGTSGTGGAGGAGLNNGSAGTKNNGGNGGTNTGGGGGGGGGNGTTGISGGNGGSGVVILSVLSSILV